ncbi:response regulator transcription factor [Chryseolinea lacunae]|uniref:Response regulator transcription factor n=1 Tax=Chryseolinea lacunae TaxID=2801331 RepID=A0ABS1KPC5_9BACT|nr:response regulator transcription factor [Chryseolinea lacunae]MBL0741310.1 response regulator transcription factor [Chryseolinea lacunae]
MKILVIEDEPAVVSFIRRGMMEAGHDVLVAMDGDTGFQMAQAEAIDVIVLDVMLPAMNGVDLCRKLREKKVDTPVIMLTALGMTENIVAGLNNGADDYLVKPFKFAELLARIAAVSRRNKAVPVANHVLKIADIALDTRSKTVSRQDIKIDLTATEYKLLEFLMQQEGRVLSRAELLEHVWGVNFDMNTNVVDVYINYLRKKIDKNYPDKLIHTVVGMGYVLRDDKNA